MLSAFEQIRLHAHLCERTSALAAAIAEIGILSATNMQINQFQRLKLTDVSGTI